MPKDRHNLRWLLVTFALAAGCILLTASNIVQNVMTTLGDTIYGGLNGQPTRVAGNTTTAQKFWSQTGDGVNSAAPSWQTVPVQGALTYYFTNTASSIATYLQATGPPYTPKTTLSYAGLATGTDTLQNWATNAGVPGLTFIPAGIYDCHVHALRSGGGTVNLQCQIWEVDAAGVDIALIGTTENSNPLTGAEIEYEMFFVDPNVYTMTSTASRVVARVRAIVSGSAPTVQIFVGGTADSHLALPSHTIDASNFVPYTGATQNVDLGSHSITVNSCTGCGGGGTFYQTFQNQGSGLTQRATANFTGAGVTCADSGGITVCTIPGGGGASGFNLIEQHTASSSASLDFTTCISSTYDDYQIELVNVLPATSTADLLIRVSTDGGATYDSGANYNYATIFYGNNAGFPGQVTNVASTSIVLGNSMANSTGAQVGTVKLFDPLNASMYKMFMFDVGYLVADTINIYRKTGNAMYKSNTAVNAFQVLFSSGNVASGTVRCYGLAK